MGDLSNAMLERLEALKREAMEKDMDVDLETMTLIPHYVPTPEDMRRWRWSLIDTDRTPEDYQGWDEEADDASKI